MKRSYRNGTLTRQRQGKSRQASLRWLMALRKTGGMTRKLRRDR